MHIHELVATKQQHFHASPTHTMPPLKGTSKTSFRLAMFPWFAFGHMTPFLHLANKLAERGHRTTLLLPNKAILRLNDSNLHPNLISLLPLSIPPVPGLPNHAETASDIPISSTSLLATALDLTRPQVEAALHAQPFDFVLYDMAYWVPALAAQLGIMSICYNVVSAASIAIALVPAREIVKPDGSPITEVDLASPPPGYPSSSVVLHEHEACLLMFITYEFGSGITFYERIKRAMQDCDAISIRTCRELEGPFCDYIQAQYKKPMFLTGPMLPEPETPPLLEDRWAKWLTGFAPGSVVFCALGSQVILQEDQFRELVLGLEMTGFPFLAVVKPPLGTATVEAALPKGFKERVGERGVVHGGWVQQPSMLSHPSVGCFVNHCGFGSMWESLRSDCQLVLVPQLGDQVLNSKLLARELKVAVEVERGEERRFTKEGVCRAIKSVMDEESELGKMVRSNHGKAKEKLDQRLMSDNIQTFVENLQQLIMS